MKSTKKIICFLIVFAMLESKVFSTPEIDWYERYEYNSEVIRELIEEKEKEQIEVNVEPQRTSFDIVIFMGGTNMVGKGTSSEAVEGIDGAGYEMQFTTQNGEPYGVSKIAEPFGDTNGSMVTAFMNSYYLNTGVPVIGIPASVDGSSIYSTWQEGQVGLENAKNKYEKTYRWMQENGYKVRHSYMIWNQGEADVENIEGYENALKNTVVEMQNVGIEKCFMVQIGGIHLYKGHEDEYRERYGLYQNMMRKQMEICENNDWITLVSTTATTLTKCSEMMTDMVHLNQKALDIVGSEAGKKVAKYADQARGSTLTEEQSNALINFAKRFSRDGFERRRLVYGINAKYKAYNLQLVRYSTPYTVLSNGSKLSLISFGPYGKDYGWNEEKTEDEFEPGDYIGLDCSGFVSFLYHHVFGLPFDYYYNNHNTPWTTEQFIENRKMTTYDGTDEVDTFKVVYEKHSKEQKYSLNDLASLANLQPGDLLIGRGGKEEGDNTDHIIIYSGKDENGKDKMIHSTSSPALYDMRENGIYYYMGESDLENSKFKYRNVYVFRLNDNIISKELVANDKPIDWNKLSVNYVYDDIAPTVNLSPNGGNSYIMPTTGNATIKTALTAEDRGGSELNILQYAWSSSNKVEPANWSDFENGVTVSKTDITTPGTWYLWTKVIDKAGNRASTVKVSNAFIIKQKDEDQELDKIVKGDVNNDGKIDTTDLLKMLRHISASKSEETANKYPAWILEGNNFKAADISGDNKVDTTDTLKLLRHISASKSEETANKYPTWIIK